MQDFEAFPADGTVVTVLSGKEKLVAMVFGRGPKITIEAHRDASLWDIQEVLTEASRAFREAAPDEVH